MICYFLPLLILLCGCAATRYGSGPSKESISTQWNTELGDVQQEVHRLHVNLDLLEEQVKKQEGVVQRLSKTPKDSPSSSLSDKKIAALESDIRQLSQLCQTTLSKMQKLEQLLATHETRFNEIAQLKGTLHSISQAIGNQPPPASVEERVHIVQSGDSLEKIARKYQTTVSAIKSLNGLNHDKIVVKQSLRIPKG